MTTGSSGDGTAAQPSFEAMFEAVFAEALALAVVKQRAYGPSNISEFGLRGVVIRASDKVRRLANLLFTDGAAPTADESIEDSLLDLLNYAVIGLACHRGWWTKERCPTLRLPVVIPVVPSTQALHPAIRTVTVHPAGMSWR